MFFFIFADFFLCFIAFNFYFCFSLLFFPFFPGPLGPNGEGTCSLGPLAAPLYLVTFPVLVGFTWAHEVWLLEGPKILFFFENIFILLNWALFEKQRVKSGDFSVLGGVP